MPEKKTKSAIVRLAIRRCRMSPWNIRSSRIKGAELAALEGPRACEILKKYEIRRK